jgi:uncharacterized protein YlxW (UPF0749 family)
MTLLREVMEQPLDPGYAAAAAHPGRPRPQVRVAVFVLAVLLGIVAVTAVVKLRAPEPAAVRSRQQLEARIRERTAAVERQQDGNAALREQIRTLQSAALEASGAQDLDRQVDALALATGEAPVTGPGLVLTVRDSPKAEPTPGDEPDRGGGEPGEGRVLDRDLQVIVNGFWSAGAEAVAVNGLRLTARSAIRSAGEAVLVDFRPISPPYQLQVIGDAAALRARFDTGAAGAYLQFLITNYGITAGYETPPRVTVPGAGNLSLREAVPAPSPSPLSSGSGSSSRPAPTTSSSTSGSSSTSTSTVPEVSP